MNSQTPLFQMDFLQCSLKINVPLWNYDPMKGHNLWIQNWKGKGHNLTSTRQTFPGPVTGQLEEQEVDDHFHCSLNFIAHSKIHFSSCPRRLFCHQEARKEVRRRHFCLGSAWCTAQLHPIKNHYFVVFLPWRCFFLVFYSSTETLSSPALYEECSKRLGILAACINCLLLKKSNFF